MKEIVVMLNTGMIVLSGLSLVAGRIFIARRQIERHRMAMLTATAFAGLFLVTYVTRWAIWGSTPFAGEGTVRSVYLGLLLIHSVAAVVIIPYVLAALKHARAGDFEQHRRRARVAFPLWLFVAISGWVVWWMLYRM